MPHVVLCIHWSRTVLEPSFRDFQTQHSTFHRSLLLKTDFYLTMTRPNVIGSIGIMDCGTALQLLVSAGGARVRSANFLTSQDGYASNLTNITLESRFWVTGVKLAHLMPPDDWRNLGRIAPNIERLHIAGNGVQEVIGDLITVTACSSSPAIFPSLGSLYLPRRSPRTGCHSLAHRSV